jgi:hypothetical protein
MNRKLLGIIVLIGSVFAIGGGKASEFIDSVRSSINSIQYRVTNLRNLEWLGGLTKPRLRFRFDLELLNPSPTSFNFNAGSTIALTKIIFKDSNNQPLITTYPSVNSIALPSQGKQIVKNIKGELPVSKIGKAIDTIAELNQSDLNMDVFISVAGKEFMINREYIQ